MATTTSNAEEDLLKDARHIESQAVRNLAGFKEYEKDRDPKVITEVFLKGFHIDIEDLARAIKGKPVVRITAASATTTEEQNRAGVYALLVQLRKDVKATPSASKQLLAAVGSGKVLSPDSTPILLKVSGTLLEWGAISENKSEAKKAGITDKKLHALEAARTALEGADTNQNAKKTDAKQFTITKAELLKTVKKKVVQVRKSASAAFNGKPKILALFASTAPRYTPKKRAPKSTKPTNPGSSTPA